MKTDEETGPVSITESLTINPDMMLSCQNIQIRQRLKLWYYFFTWYWKCEGWRDSQQFVRGNPWGRPAWRQHRPPGRRTGPAAPRPGPPGSPRPPGCTAPLVPLGPPVRPPCHGLPQFLPWPAASCPKNHQVDRRQFTRFWIWKILPVAQVQSVYRLELKKSLRPVLRIRSRRIRMILSLLDPDPVVQSTDPDPSIIKQK